jgi:hypothetical protein
LSKLVYIAGPYTASTQLGIEANINKAREAALWCAEHRVFYFSPHLNSAFFEQWLPEVPVSFYYAMDEEILSRCDALLLLKGWQFSKGAQREYTLFEKYKRPVFSYPDGCNELLKWHRGEDE